MSNGQKAPLGDKVRQLTTKSLDGMEDESKKPVAAPVYLKPPFTTLWPGDDIYWYAAADATKPPALAKLVLIHDDKGMADLLVFTDGTVSKQVNVPHLSCPGLYDDLRGMRTPLADRKGAWDFHPRLRPANAPASAVPAVQSPRKDPFDNVDSVRQVLEAAQSTKSLQATVTLAIPLGFTAGDVATLCRQNGLLKEQLP